MKVFKEVKWEVMILSLLCMALGLVVLIMKGNAEEFLCRLLGFVMIVGGTLSCVGYLIRDTHENYFQNGFLYGLICIGFGILILVETEKLYVYIPYIMLGLVIVSGFSKLQDTIDMKGMKFGNWYIILALSAANIILAVFLMKFLDNAVFKGICLLYSGVTDCLITAYFADKRLAYLKEEEEKERKLKRAEELEKENDKEKKKDKKKEAKEEEE